MKTIKTIREIESVLLDGMIEIMHSTGLIQYYKGSPEFVNIENSLLSKETGLKGILNRSLVEIRLNNSIQGLTDLIIGFKKEYDMINGGIFNFDNSTIKGMLSILTEQTGFESDVQKNLSKDNIKDIAKSKLGVDGLVMKSEFLNLLIEGLKEMKEEIRLERSEEDKENNIFYDIKNIDLDMIDLTRIRGDYRRIQRENDYLTMNKSKSKIKSLLSIEYSLNSTKVLLKDSTGRIIFKRMFSGTSRKNVKENLDMITEDLFNGE